MNNAEFLKWFRKTGFKWRGWPVWDSGGLTDVNTTTDHEAAGLVREHLRVELGVCGVGIMQQGPEWFEIRDFENRDPYEHLIDVAASYNTALVSAVEAQMKEEADRC